MTSGIYKLTFASGREYIGKSINIEARWEQHAEKFRKGTAARLMQIEYEEYGFPDTEIVYRCHEDHLDIIEDTMIWRHVPMLNGTKGRDRLEVPPSKREHLEDLCVNELFQLSTLDHLAEIIRLRKLLNK